MLNVSASKQTSVLIQQPKDATFFTPFEEIVFEVDDKEIANITKISWSSNIDGEIGTIPRLKRQLSQGSHIITLETESSQGKKLSRSH